MFVIVAKCAKSRAVRESRSVPLSAMGEGGGEDVVEPDRFFPPGSPHAGGWTQPPERWPDACAERAETLKRVGHAIERLTGLPRQVILLRDVEGWAAKDVSALLGITEVHQRVLLHRARSRVRAELERHFAA
jgi:RNA polymerase sigma-70 factor (ECF subfamily)